MLTPIERVNPSERVEHAKLAAVDRHAIRVSECQHRREALAKEHLTVRLVCHPAILLHEPVGGEQGARERAGIRHGLLQILDVVGHPAGTLVREEERLVQVEGVDDPFVVELRPHAERRRICSSGSSRP